MQNTCMAGHHKFLRTTAAAVLILKTILTDKFYQIRFCYLGGGQVCVLHFGGGEGDETLLVRTCPDQAQATVRRTNKESTIWQSGYSEQYPFQVFDSHVIQRACRIQSAACAIRHVSPMLIDMIQNQDSHESVRQGNTRVCKIFSIVEQNRQDIQRVRCNFRSACRKPKTGRHDKI